MPLVIELRQFGSPLVRVFVYFLQIGGSEDCIIIRRLERAGAEASTAWNRVLVEANRVTARVCRPTLIDIDSYRVQERLQVCVWVFSEVFAQHLQRSTVALFDSLAGDVLADGVLGDLAG